MYEDIKSAIGNVERNEVLRALVRYSIKADEQRKPVTGEVIAEPSGGRRRLPAEERHRLLVAAGGVRVRPPALAGALAHDGEAQEIDLERREEALRRRRRRRGSRPGRPTAS